MIFKKKKPAKEAVVTQIVISEGFVINVDMDCGATQPGMKLRKA